MITLGEFDTLMAERGFKRIGILSMFTDDKFMLTYENIRCPRQQIHVLYFHRQSIRVFQEMEIESIVGLTPCAECMKPNLEENMKVTGIDSFGLRHVCKACLWDEKLFKRRPRVFKVKDRSRIRNRRKKE